MTKALKAYEVRDDDEGNCCIVFATNNAAARRDGAGELNTDWECIEHCRRAPHFDDYAPGPVPLAALIDAGWWHECSHCGCRFDSDGRRYEEEGERDDEFDPIESGGSNYCSPTCMMEEWAERRARSAMKHAVIEACATHWPGATNIHADRYCTSRSNPSHDNTEWRATFHVPGLKYDVNWTLGEKTVMVSECDVEAFKAWTAVSNPRR